MDPTLVPGTRFESQFQICVYEHAILNVSLSTLVPASLPMQLTSVKTLNGTNYEDWKESLDLYLAITNMDLALREC